MLTFHARMPVLSPAAFRRLEASWFLLLAVLGGSVAHPFGPGLLMVPICLAGVLAADALAEVALHGGARRRGSPFVPRRDRRAAWHEASRAASVPLISLRALLIPFAVAQAVLGEPCREFGRQGWNLVASDACMLFLLGFLNRRTSAAARAPADQRGAGEPTRGAA